MSLVYSYYVFALIHSRTRIEWMAGFSRMYSCCATIAKSLCTCNIKTGNNFTPRPYVGVCFICCKKVKQHLLPRAPFLLWLPIQYVEQCMTAPPRALMKTTRWMREIELLASHSSYYWMAHVNYCVERFTFFRFLFWVQDVILNFMNKAWWYHHLNMFKF